MNNGLYLFFLLLAFLGVGCNEQAKLMSSPEETQLIKKPIIFSQSRNWEETGAMCAINNGEIYCWGETGFANDMDTQGQSLTPTKITSLGSNVIGVAQHSASITCGVYANGSLRCAGNNGVDPNNILFSNGVTKVVTNYHTTCAIVYSALKCWGRNDVGQLGDGTLIDRPTPVDVIGMDSGVTDLSLGQSSVCAIKNGALYCWGGNEVGDLDGGLANRITTPVAIPSLSSRVTAISVGYGNYSLPGDAFYAIQDGALYTWGRNDYGQLGDGTTTDRLTPSILPGMNSGVTQVDTNGISGCALKDGDVYCFGINAFGITGIPENSNSYLPTKIEGIGEEILSISAGSLRGCGSTESKIYCWGYNLDKIIENSNMDSIITPTVVYTKN